MGATAPNCSWCCGDLRLVDLPGGQRAVCVHCGRFAPEVVAGVDWLASIPAKVGPNVMGRWAGGSARHSGPILRAQE
jgi:hypothetical protein